MLLLALFPAMFTAAVLGALQCPSGMSQMDSVEITGTAWLVCEDLQQPSGAVALVSADDLAWFPKSYSMYGSSNDEDASYYLGLGKKNVTSAKSDLLGIAMLNHSEITWSLVADAVCVSL
jgi:hypothetical protein